MRIFDANYWDDNYITNKIAERKRREKAAKSKKERILKIRNNNSTIKGMAKHYAEEMKKEPSALEKKMIELLDNHNIIYEFQKPLYIQEKDSMIKRFYIADFYTSQKFDHRNRWKIP